MLTTWIHTIQTLQWFEFKSGVRATQMLTAVKIDSGFSSCQDCWQSLLVFLMKSSITCFSAAEKVPRTLHMVTYELLNWKVNSGNQLLFQSCIYMLSWGSSWRFNIFITIMSLSASRSNQSINQSIKLNLYSAMRHKRIRGTW